MEIKVDDEKIDAFHTTHTHQRQISHHDADQEN
jgi:hypothetical protein